MAQVVIPVYGQARLLARLLEAVTDHELILVDDASPDAATRTLVRTWAERPNVHAVYHEDNRGFPATANAGASRVTADRFFLLNSDLVPRPGWDTAMNDRLDRHPEAAAVGARLLFPDGITVQHAGVDFRKGDGLPVHVHRYHTREALEVARPRALAMVTHAAVLLRTEAFREAGGYDEGYGPGMYEDCDLGLRLREHGYCSFYEPAAELLHEESASFGQRSDLMAVKMHGKERFIHTWVRTGRYEPLRMNREIL